MLRRDPPVVVQVFALLLWMVLAPTLVAAQPASIPPPPIADATETERWIWATLRAGNHADLNSRCGQTLDPKSTTDPRWEHPCRQVSGRFLEALLTSDGWRAAPAHRGVNISGARVLENVNLSGAVIGMAIYMKASRLDAWISFEDTRFERGFFFDSVVFNGGLFAERMTVSGSSFLRNGTVIRREALSIGGTQISGDLDLSGIIIETELKAESISVGRSVFLGNGAKIAGSVSFTLSRFGGDLDLSGSRFERGLKLDKMDIAGSVTARDKATVSGGPMDLNSTKVDQQLVLNTSTFAEGVNADSIRVGGSFFARDGVIVKNHGLVITGAKIEGGVFLSDSEFSAGINAHSAVIDGSFVLHNGSVGGRALNLWAADIGGIINISHSKIDLGIEARQIRVGRDFFGNNLKQVGGVGLQLDSATLAGSLVLQNARLEGGLSARRASINGDINAPNIVVTTGNVSLDSAKIGGFVSFIDASIKTPIHLGSVDIATFLDISGAQEIAELDLSHSTIHQEFRLGQPGSSAPTWTRDAILSLRNAKVGALIDSPGPNPILPQAWPQTVVLSGLTYERLSASDADRAQDMGFRPVTYFINLLARDTWFSPQPYHQLASVFLGAGDSERAEAILYAAKERERHEETDVWGRTGLWLLKVTVGYGIGSGPWLILVWVLGVTLVGMVVLARSPGGRGKSWSWRFGASLDHLLPIVELSPEFTKFFDDPGRERLAGWQMGYFAVHAILGYVLAAVLAAAVAGLTHSQ